MKAALLLSCALSVSLAVIVAGNWKAKHPTPPVVVEQRPLQEIQTPHVAPGHLRIYNATDKDMGAMIYQKGRGVICPKLPPSFGIACIEIAAGKDVDYVLQPLATKERKP